MWYKVNRDLEFIELAKEIIDSREFRSLKKIKHHLRTTRYEHSIRVAYWSYIIAKKLKWNVREVVRGALLHDLVYSHDTDVGFNSHPKRALENALIAFELCDMEIDIITKHMFPSYLAMPKYKESWLVCLVDTASAVKEFCTIVNNEIAC